MPQASFLQNIKYEKTLPWMQTVLDLIVANAIFIGLAYLMQEVEVITKLRMSWLAFEVSALLTSLYVYSIHSQRMLRAEALVRGVLVAALILVVLYAAITVFLSIGKVQLRFFLGLYVAYIVVISALWLVELKVLKRLRSSGRNARNVVIVGTGPAAMELTRLLLDDVGYGIRIRGYFDRQCHPDFQGAYVGNLHDLDRFCRNNRVDVVFYAASTDDERSLHQAMRIADTNFCNFYITPMMLPSLQYKFYMENISGTIPAICVEPSPLSNVLNRFTKRTFDIVFSSVVLIILTPLVFLPVAIAVKASSPGPVFFRQKRTGYHGKDFWCFKFRTMKVNADSDKAQASKDDPRKTRVGDFLRRTSIDELPQFWNVLRGDMSVVGPRPHMLAHTEEYRRLIDRYMLRHVVKPGITGWAQIRGFRGATGELWQMERRVDSDVWYIENWSFLLDLKIIVKTVTNALHGEENAY